MMFQNYQPSLYNQGTLNNRRVSLSSVQNLSSQFSSRSFDEIVLFRVTHAITRILQLRETDKSKIPVMLHQHPSTSLRKHSLIRTEYRGKFKQIL